MGTPQRRILSPLLSNIYLHELDMFIEQLRIKYQRIKTHRDLKRNKVYTNLKYRGRKSEIYRNKIPDKKTKDHDFIELKYIRYADDFLIGVVGNRKLA